MEPARNDDKLKQKVTREFQNLQQLSAAHWAQ